jgi:hypothetical protein
LASKCYRPSFSLTRFSRKHDLRQPNSLTIHNIKQAGSSATITPYKKYLAYQLVLHGSLVAQLVEQRFCKTKSEFDEESSEIDVVDDKKHKKDS